MLLLLFSNFSRISASVSYFLKGHVQEQLLLPRKIGVLGAIKRIFIAFCVILDQITFSLKLCCEMPLVMLQLTKASKTSVVTMDSMIS